MAFMRNMQAEAALSKASNKIKAAEFDIICKQCGAKGRIVGAEKARVFENLIRNRKGSEILFTYGLNEDEEESLMIRCIKCGALLEDTI